MVAAILTSIGGLGLFLLGMGLMTDGLKTLAGPSLRRLLGAWTRNPASGALGGALVTAVVQSSSATMITAVGLVGAGLLSFQQTLGIIFGANVGTTATAWLVAFFGFKVSLGIVAMPLVLVGVLIRMFASDRVAAIGHSLAGFALIFIGIDVLQSGMAAFEGIVTPDSFPSDDILGKLQLVGIGVAITLVTQSSSAGVAAAMTALHAGTIGFGQAAAMVIGMNVGTTITAVLASIGGGSAVKRTAYAHVIYNVLTGVVAFALLGPCVQVVGLFEIGDNPQIFLAAFHSFFNCLGLALFLPLTKHFGALLERLIPTHGPVLSRHLERRLLHDPPLAADAAQSTLLEITAWTTAILRPIFAGQKQGALEQALAPLTQVLAETHEYLAELSKRKTSERVSRKAVHLMYAADHLDRVVVRLGRRDRIHTIVSHSELQQAALELDSITARIEAWVREPSDSELVDDAAQAWRRLEEYKEAYRKDVLERAANGRLTVPDSMQRLDGMRWLVRVAHHLWRLMVHFEAAHANTDDGPSEAAEHEADA